MSSKIVKLVGQRTELIEALNKRLESVVGVSQRKLLDYIIEDFVDQLDTKDGKIQNTLRNQRLVGLLDKTFQTYVESHGVQVLKTMVDGVQSVLQFNKRYFQALTTPGEMIPLDKLVKSSVSQWLGVEDGSAARNGYLDTLVKVDSLKQQVKDLAMGKVIGQAGYSDTRKAVRQFLTDEDDGTLGGLRKYYRQFTFDLYSQVDRTAAKISADKLDLRYAIYEGGLIKTSRKFCRERNGKVFTSEEIADFDPPEAKPPNYNPFVDLGGYQCRHHLNFVPYAVAVALRPDLKK